MKKSAARRGPGRITCCRVAGQRNAGELKGFAGSGDYLTRGALGAEFRGISFLSRRGRRFGSISRRIRDPMEDRRDLLSRFLAFESGLGIRHGNDARAQCSQVRVWPGSGSKSRARSPRATCQCPVSVSRWVRVSSLKRPCRSVLRVSVAAMGVPSGRRSPARQVPDEVSFHPRGPHAEGHRGVGAERQQAEA